MSALAVFSCAGFTFVSSAFAYAPRTAGGSLLKWRSQQIVISVSNTGSEHVSAADLENAVRKSFRKWSDASGVEFVIKRTSERDVSSRKSGGDGFSLVTIAPTAANMLLFEADENNSGVTRLFFDKKGRIVEADIVLNPSALFTVDGSRGSFDLESTLTHEAGHFLGLAHSDVRGATMYRHQGKNGVFNLPGTYPRTLASDDMAGIRHIYGSPRKGRNSFGSLSGALSNQQFKGRDRSVWLESASTGTVVAGVEVRANGSFSFKSLPVGDYFLIATLGDYSIINQGVGVSIEAGREKRVTVQSKRSSSPNRVRSFGFNGQISNLAVPVEAGHRYTVYAKINGEFSDRLRLESGSPGISVDDASLAFVYERKGETVVSFEIFVSAFTGRGEYAFSVYDGFSEVGYLPGVLIVDEVRNPWHSAFF
ncbi:MAG: matrixin family metalloprotease [Pyrinomonadaceae bacterium]|nr:matrixin family metalloprotease [Pyrinomonadaceae bacterium]